MACRNSPFFPAILFCLLQSSDWALRALTKEKMLHSIFPLLLLWGMCKMRSSQYYMRSILNSLCGLQADWDLMIYCILNTSTVKWIQEALSHISWAFTIQSSGRLGEKKEDLAVCLWLPPPWKLREAWCPAAGREQLFLQLAALLFLIFPWRREGGKAEVQAHPYWHHCLWSLQTHLGTALWPT